MDKQPTGTALPDDLPAPARRALEAAGYQYLEQVADLSDEELLALHGVGPKAVGRLRSAVGRMQQGRHLRASRLRGTDRPR